MTSSPTQTSPSFFKDEFERALSEHSFGLSSYNLISSSALDATAIIELLEKSKLEVTLTIRGYQVRIRATIWFKTRIKRLVKIANTAGNTDAGGEPSAGATVFESLESLLLHVSPVYTVKRTELLLSKLAS